MIATILPGSTNFHAVGYNEHKVSKGNARLLEMKNFGPIGKFGTYTVDDLVNYLLKYSDRNDRIQKAQFHLAISCKGKECTEQQLLDFAHQYLKEMGYGEEGQPVLIYAHYDTDNRHLHIVTSRIAPNGKKIDHNNERRRSQKVIDKILGQDRAQTTRDDIETAKSYSFSKLTQFKGIMSTMGYEVYVKEDTVNIKKGGQIQIKLPIQEIEALFKSEKRDTDKEKKLKAIFLKYRNACSNKEELLRDLKKNFGIDIIFFGHKESPYGYMVIDHHNKTVHQGNHILAIKSLLDFTTPEEKLESLDKFITDQLEVNPLITTYEISKKIRRSHASIKNGVLYYKDNSSPLIDEVVTVLNRNDRLNLVSQFNPTSQEERDILCKLFKVEEFSEMVNLNISAKESSVKIEIKDRLSCMFASLSGQDLRSSIRGEGLILKFMNNNYFVIDIKGKIILNLNNEGLDISKLHIPLRESNNMESIKINKKTTRPHSHKIINNTPGILSATTGQGVNREWEVGKKKKDRDNMDDQIENGLKYYR